MRNKQFLWDAFADPASTGQPWSTRQWLPGYKLVLSADSVLIYSAGHRAFKIDLSFSPDTVAELAKQARMLLPNQPNSVATLEAYKEDRRRAQQRASVQLPPPPADTPGPSHGVGPAGGTGAALPASRAHPPRPELSPAVHPSRVGTANLERMEADVAMTGVSSCLWRHQ